MRARPRGGRRGLDDVPDELSWLVDQAASYGQTRGQARAALTLCERAYATASVTSALAVQHGCRARMDQQSDGWFLSAAYRRMA